MPTKAKQIDPRVDAYIAKSADFAKPILSYLRATIHSACPDVEETIKWSHPHFIYKGLLCNMASFKAHCAFGFWKGKLVIAPKDDQNGTAMGQFGRIASLKDLPSKGLIVKYIHAAMALNEAGVKSPTRSKPTLRAAPKPSADFAAALKRSAKARNTFDNFSPGQRREYVDWINEAKRDATRASRIKTAIEWLAEGKIRNWKYATPR
jgi:uncharacterized protein YdeI (YjbR/CyaY-like superfamily)